METLPREPFVAALPAAHVLAGKKELSLSALAKESLVRISRPDIRHAFSEVDRQMDGAGIDLDRCRVVETTLAALALV
jgi:DNA-binding transcriptional LysR family regulator